MATNPGSITDTVFDNKSKGTAKPLGRAKYFAEFLRTAPALVTREWLQQQLFGTRSDLRTAKDMSNVLVYAQRLHQLSSQDDEGTMKNKLANRPTGSTPRTTSAGAVNPPRTNGPAHGLEIAMVYLEEAETLVGRALLNKASVTIEDLMSAVLKQAAAFRAVVDGQQ
jgi:hypothetical protein